MDHQIECVRQIMASGQQTIDYLKEALLPADGIAVYGSMLAASLAKNNAENWNRQMPDMSICPEALEHAGEMLQQYRQALKSLDKILLTEKEAAVNENK